MSSAVYTRITRKIHGSSVSDGAGVKLTRVIGSPQLDMLDPFLMLDEFGTDQPQDYLAGFPDHPHRGFETVTYMLEGRMRHKDNHGNEGVLVPGSVQWMTAGRGLVHSEMPEQSKGRMRGFQLWINLPASEKMGDPKYQEFGPDRIPMLWTAPGVSAKVIAGTVGEVQGPVRSASTDPPRTGWDTSLPEGHNAFIYVYEGEMAVGDGADQRAIGAGDLAVLGGGSVALLRSSPEGAQFLLIAGRPLGEPVARYGPFVMNTHEEIRQAFFDLQEGRF
jgi:redox-sensitive bicupin YhaK (pirin superfamily)